MLGVGGRLPRSRNWAFLSIYTLRQFCSISLACNPARIIRQAGHVLYFTRVECVDRDAHSRRRTEPSVTEPNVDGTSNSGDSLVIYEVFSMFKSYLEVKLDEKSKEIESKSKVDKQVTLMKFKGNQKQFEHNAQIDSIFDRLTTANVPENKYLSGK